MSCLLGASFCFLPRMLLIHIFFMPHEIKRIWRIGPKVINPPWLRGAFAFALARFYFVCPYVSFESFYHSCPFIIRSCLSGIYCYESSKAGAFPSYLILWNSSKASSLLASVVSRPSQNYFNLRSTGLASFSFGGLSVDWVSAFAAVQLVIGNHSNRWYISFFVP